MASAPLHPLHSVSKPQNPGFSQIHHDCNFQRNREIFNFCRYISQADKWWNCIKKIEDYRFRIELKHFYTRILDSQVIFRGGDRFPKWLIRFFLEEFSKKVKIQQLGLNLSWQLIYLRVFRGMSRKKIFFNQTRQYFERKKLWKTRIFCIFQNHKKIVKKYSISTKLCVYLL